MEDSFYYCGYTEEIIEKQKFICIRVLDYEKFCPIKIYKKFTDELLERVQESFDLFENVTDNVTFVIKQDRKTKNLKVVFDIKI